MNKLTKRKGAWTELAKLSVEASLADLAVAEDNRKKASTRVDLAVAVLRSPDINGHCLASWEEIGRALGITKQAAQQRYGRRGL